MLVVGSGIEDGSVLSSLLYLYQNLQEGSLNEDLVEREACEFVFSHLKAQDHGFPMCGQICTAIEAVERDAKSKNREMGAAKTRSQMRKIGMHLLLMTMIIASRPKMPLWKR